MAFAASTSCGADPARIAPSVKTFMAKYCTDCHGPDHDNPALRFNAIPHKIADAAVAQRWQDILDVLNLDEMPPDDAPQPAREELSNALETLTTNLAEARKRLTDSGGQVVLRRLNRREYKLTIDALFGVPVDVEKLPEDGTIDGFDTVGQAHSFSSLHLERYLELGRQVLDQVIVYERSTTEAGPAAGSNPKGLRRRFRQRFRSLSRRSRTTTSKSLRAASIWRFAAKSPERRSHCRGSIYLATMQNRVQSFPSVV